LIWFEIIAGICFFDLFFPERNNNRKTNKIDKKFEKKFEKKLNISLQSSLPLKLPPHLNLKGNSHRMTFFLLITTPFTPSREFFVLDKISFLFFSKNKNSSQTCFFSPTNLHIVTPTLDCSISSSSLHLISLL